jgi:hypothetical protein
MISIRGIATSFNEQPLQAGDMAAVIMLTDSEKMYESSMADRFYEKDLNILNRIRFYLGTVIQFLRYTG